MDNRIKKILNSKLSVNNVNENINTKLILYSDRKFIPKTQTNTVVSQNDVFDNERKNSNIFRLITKVDTYFNNQLPDLGYTSVPKKNDNIVNGTIKIGLGTLNDTVIKRTSTFQESFQNNLINEDGWLKIITPLIQRSDYNEKITLTPNEFDFDLNKDNWKINICILKEKNNPVNSIIHDGIRILSNSIININNKNLNCLYSVIPHNLNIGDRIKIKGINGGDKEVTIKKLGNENNENNEYYFCIEDITFNINSTTRFSKIIDNEEVEYYFRVVKPINVNITSLSKLGFSKNLYNDNIKQIMFEDIDLSDYTDYLNRPITDLYLQFIRKDNKGFTLSKSGLDLEYDITLLNPSNINVPNINLITNSNNSATKLEDINENGTSFILDIVEFSKTNYLETKLIDVSYRFNRKDREIGNISVNNINMGTRHEGYKYKPFFNIKTKNVSTNIEYSNPDTDIIPEYAILLKDGRYIWRDILDIGFNDDIENQIDYPFLNGTNYIFSDFKLFINRQDANNLYNLRYNSFPNDVIGNLLDDSLIRVKKIDTIC